MKITATTTLGELITILGNIKRAEKTPTSKALREAADPIADMQGCLVYANGYVVYDNGYGRTVMWLPSCVSFTYHFTELKETEKNYMSETETLPEGMLESLPWFMALTVVGDHRIEANAMNRRMGGRKGTKEYRVDDDGDRDGDTEEAWEASYRHDYTWMDGHFGESPETAIIREEMRGEMLADMTEKQREVFVLYYQDGYTQDEIADHLRIGRTTVQDRLIGALKKAKKIL